MPAFNKFSSFSEALSEGVHNLGADTLRLALTNTAPLPTQTAFDGVTNHPPPTNANGYTSGGAIVTVTASSQSAGAYTLSGSDVTFTAAGGSLGPFRYALLYNDTASNDELIGFWDCGSSITLLAGETFRVNFGATILQVMARVNVTEYDLFLIAGQSNAEGRGASASSPATLFQGQAYLATSSSLTLLADPVGGANTGSAWPAFANSWLAATGRGSIFVERATGGAALLAASNPSNNWSDTGALKSAAETEFAGVQTYLSNSHPGITLNNKYALWCQGESEAQNINGTTITGPLYQTALESLIDEWETDLGLTRFCIFRTGTTNTDTTATNANWKAIRDAQDAAQAARPTKSLVVFRGAVDFPNESKMVDSVHYNQTGLNEMGALGAINLAALQNDVG